MATLAEMLNTIIEVQGHEHSNATVIARHVREDELISSGGRGLGAAQMTDKDAATLLIALAVSSPAVRAAKITRAYRALQAREPGELFGLDEVPPVLDTLGAALTALVGMYRSRNAPDEFLRLEADYLQNALSEDRLRARVRFQRINRTAALELWIGSEEETEEHHRASPRRFIFRPREGWTNELVERPNGRKFQAVRYAPSSAPDFGIETSFTDRTLQVVGKVLRE